MSSPLDTEKQAKWLFKLFQGRRGVFAYQFPDGHYEPMNRPPTPDDYARHLRGEWTIGFYVLRENDTVRVICFDLDGADAPSKAAKFAGDLSRTYPDARNAFVIEDTGGRGYHVWVLLAEWVPAAHARAWGLARASEHGLSCEVFPKQSHARTHGNLVRVPLGVHAKYGRAGHFVTLDPSDFAAADPAALGIDTTPVPPAGADTPSTPASAVGTDGPASWPDCMARARLGLPQGARDEGLFRLACFLFARGVSETAALRVVRDAAARSTPPAPAALAEQKVRQAYTGDYPAYCAADCDNPTVRATACEHCPRKVDVAVIEDDTQLDGLEDLMTIEPGKPATWLIEPFVPEGRLVLVAGEEGRGKSLLMARWAVQLAADGHPVLWFPTEDDPGDDIRPRVDAVATQLGVTVPQRRIFVAQTMLRFNADDTSEHALQQWRTMHRWIRFTGARAVIMDAGRDYLAPRGDQKEFSYNNEADVRPTLKRLAMGAKRRNLTLLMVHHFNKNTALPQVKYRTTGSAAWLQVPRHVLGVWWDEKAASGAVGIMKSNIASTDGIMEYTVGATPDGVPLLSVQAVDMAMSLEAWAAARRSERSSEVRIDWADDVREWAERTLSPGARFPNRDELMQQFSMTQTEAGDTLRALNEQGLVTQGGRKGLVWTGRPAAVEEQ